MQACAACGARRFPPRPMCPGCQSLDSVWQVVSGRAAIFSYVICHPPVLPAFRDRTPYAVVLVELADAPGIRMLGNLLEAPLSSVRVGLPVEVCFEDAGGGVVLPQWRPAQPEPAGSAEDTAEAGLPTPG